MQILQFKMKSPAVMLAVLIFICCDLAAQSAVPAAKNVLIINSYHESFEWTRNQVTGITEAFERRMPQANLFIAYLDTKRFPNKEIWHKTFSVEVSKYPPGFIDLIIVTDDNAYQTMLKHHNEIGDIPVVFSGLNGFDPKEIEGLDNITGLVEYLDFEGTYKLACKLAGKKYKKVAIITDNTVTGQAQKQVAVQWFEQNADLEPIWLDGAELSFVQLQQQLQRLDEDALVIMAIWQRGRGGTYYSAETTYPLIEKAAGRPVFGVVNIAVGNGVIGGSILDGRHHGNLAGEMAIDILSGKDISTIPVDIDPSGYVILDEASMRRYQMPSIVEDDWELINSPVSFYQQHKVMIVSAAIISIAELVLIMLLVVNMVRRRQASRELKIANETMQALHDAMPDLIMVVDVNGNYLRIHEPGNKLLNINSPRKIGTSLTDIFDGETSERLLELIREVIRTRKVTTIEYLRPDRKRWLEGHVAPLPSELFGVEAVMWIARDIHNYKTLINELDENRARYKSVVEDSPASICVMSPAGIIEFGNISYSRYFGIPQNELGGVSIYDLIPPEDHQLVRKNLSSLTPEHSIGINEHQVIDSNGSIRWIRWTNRAFFKSDGSCRAIQSFGEDITDRVSVEHQLRDSERNLRVTLNSIGDGVISTDCSGTVMQMNQVAEKLTGISSEDAIGRDLSEVFIIQDVETDEVAENPVGHVLRTGKIHGLAEGTVLISKDGSRYRISDSAAPIIDQDGQIIGVVLTFRDITAEYEKDRLLNESQQQKEIVLKYSGEIITYLDRDLHVVWTNSPDFIEGEVPGGLSCCQAMFGKQIDCGSCVAREVINGAPEGLKELELDDGRNFQILYTPVNDSAGQVQGIIAAARDITEQQSLRQQLIHSDRMSAIGRLAGGIAHDFNNLLQVMVGYGELLSEQVDAQGRESLKNIMDAAGKARNLVKQLLVFSRSDQDHARVTSPDEILKNTASLLKPLIGENISLKLDADCRGVFINADPEKLQQVMMNICINARDAMDGRGEIVLSAKAENIQHAQAQKLGLAAEGDYVAFRICDNGPGIADDVIDHIFEPFYTTKEVGNGSGLGLATAYAIVNKSGGCIQAVNLPDGGAMFEFYIPSSDGEESIEKTFEEENDISLRFSGQCILLAEDDPMVRRYTTRLLEKMNLEVITASDGQKAVEMFTAEPNRFSLVILDAIMPEMNGREAFEAITAVRSDVAVLFATGYSSELLEGDFIANKPDVILQKPFTAMTLARAISKFLS